MTTIRAGYVVVLAVFATSCDVRITLPSIVNTATNSTNTSIDSHDVLNFSPVFPIPGQTTPNPTNPAEPESPLAIPADAQATATAVASLRAADLAKSCQDTYGAAAWTFLDAIVTALKAKDPRWGYLCKRGDCTDISRDVIAYRATADTTGLWAVDIIGNHCPVAPAVSTFTWQVLGFDPLAMWKATRQ